MLLVLAIKRGQHIGAVHWSSWRSRGPKKLGRLALAARAAGRAAGSALGVVLDVDAAGANLFLAGGADDRVVLGTPVGRTLVAGEERVARL